MSALVSPRDTREYSFNPEPTSPYLLLAAAGAKCIAGGIAAIFLTGGSAGYVAPATAALNLCCIGRFDGSFDNTGGGNGGTSIDAPVGRQYPKVCVGQFWFNNSSAGDLVAQAQLYQFCYLVDDNTVAKTSGSATRSIAGIVVGLDSVLGVLVAMSPMIAALYATLNGSAELNMGLSIFGDGSDGALVYDGAATILGMAPSTNVYTLTRDIFASAITVNAGVTINAAGFRIFCSGTMTIAATGVVSNDGNAGGASSASTGGAAGAISSAGSTAQGTAGGAGSSGTGAGTAATSSTTGFPGGTGVGGAGGTAGGGNTGGTASWTALVATKGGARHLLALVGGMTFGTAGINVFGGGSGGGGGGANNADGGGGGGGGGGGVLIVAAFTLANLGAMHATGGAGSAGTSAGNSAGGGGGGGGGVVITVARFLSGNVPTAAGGAGGAKVGAAGVAGVAGTAGVVVQVAA